MQKLKTRTLMTADYQKEVFSKFRFDAQKFLIDNDFYYIEDLLNSDEVPENVKNHMKPILDKKISDKSLILKFPSNKQAEFFLQLENQNGGENQWEDCEIVGNRLKIVSKSFNSKTFKNMRDFKGKIVSGEIDDSDGKIFNDLGGVFL